MAGAAAVAGEMEKDLFYSFNVESAGSLFYPLVVESFLVLWTSSSLEILKVIAKKTALTNGLTIGKT